MSDFYQSKTESLDRQYSQTFLKQVLGDKVHITISFYCKLTLLSKTTYVMSKEEWELTR